MGFKFNTNSINQTSGGGSGGNAVWGSITGTLSNQTDLNTALSNKQNALISGTNIKTINDNSLLGSGNLAINASVNTDNVTINKNSSNELQTIGIQEARTNTAIRLWTGNQTQYNDGGSQTYYNWQYTSSGGINIVNTNISFVPKAVAYGNSKYIAVGVNGIIYSSIDNGDNWTAETSGINVDLNGIAYGNNKFIAVGNSGTIISSSGDGTWTAETISGATVDFVSICFGNNLFVIGGNYSYNASSGKHYYSSGDGTWTETALNKGYFSVVYANGYFYGLRVISSYNADDDRVIVAYTEKSSDANNWTETYIEEQEETSYSDVRIVAIGNIIYYHYIIGSSYSRSKYSTDGTTWNDWDNVSLISLPFNGAYDGTTYYALIQLDKTYLTTSSDGINYSNLNNVTGISYLCYGDALVGVGGNSTLNVMTYGSATTYNVYTTDENPTTESTVYSAPSTPSALTITTVGTGTITLSDTNTYDYNASGNQIVTQNVGQAHPDWLCFIEGVGIKMGNVSFIPTVDQTYDATSANAQSGVAVASGISDTLGTINTQLESIIAQGD